jgi:hypothetical protein
MSELICNANLSPDRKYRYSLMRVWDREKGIACFIGLNPSTADESADDPTIKKCMKFARRWGCGGILMLNVFAFRTPWPRELKAARKRGVDIIGLQGNALANIWLYLQSHPPAKIVCAWGKNAGDRGREVAKFLEWKGATIYCFNLNKDGSPVHPLYQRDDCEPQEFRA